MLEFEFGTKIINNNIYKQSKMLGFCSKLLFKVSRKSISKKV